MAELISVYGYLRVSSDGQALYGNGINGQKGAIEDFADRNGYYIEKFYKDEGVSGSLASRKGLDEMLADLKKANKNKANPKIKHIIVDDIDRIARDMRIWLDKTEEIQSMGATIISLKQRVEDTPEGRFNTGMAMLSKQYERENNSRRVASRQAQRLKDGYWCYNLPIGYKFEKAPHGGGRIAVPDEPTFSIVSQGLKLLANGTLVNQAALIKYLNDRGVKTHSGGPVNDKFMSRMINKGRLPLYAGFIDFPQWGIHMVKGKHKAAITEKEYYKIITKFKARDFYKDHTPDDISNNLGLRRILRCGKCGGLLSGSASKGHGGEYYYYYCFNEKCPCFRKSYNSKKIDNEIENLLSMLQLDEDYMDAFKVILDAVWKEKGETKQQQIKLKENELNKINTAITATVDKITTTNSEIVYKALEDRIKVLDEEKKQREAELAAIKGTTDNYVNEFNSLKSVIKCPLNVWKTSDIELKRLLISGIFNDTLSYSNDKGLRTSEIPLIYAENSEIQEKINQNKKSQLRTYFSPAENGDIKKQELNLG